jgi:hypothetical protein
MEPVTSSVSGIDTVLSDPLLSTKTVRADPVTSTHIRGRCHAISQSSKSPYISGPHIHRLSGHPEPARYGRRDPDRVEDSYQRTLDLNCAGSVVLGCGSLGLHRAFHRADVAYVC